MKINIVSLLPSFVWQRQEIVTSNIVWTYSKEPVSADVYVVYGVITAMTFPNPQALKIFVTPEPPEVFQYDLGQLAKYDLVLANNFRYLDGLDSVVNFAGILNWSVGVSYSSGTLQESMSISDVIFKSHMRKDPLLSIVTSNKSFTPLQVLRLKFIDYLVQRMENIVLFGRGINPIDDKADALLPYRFHLAIENSSHDSFWTEKISDPLLARCETFYFGDPKINEFFSDIVVHRIDLRNFEQSYRLIRHFMEKEDRGEIEEQLTVAQRMILTNFNLHNAILLILGDHTRVQNASGVVAIGRHRIPILKRMEFIRNKMRYEI